MTTVPLAQAISRATTPRRALAALLSGLLFLTVSVTMRPASAAPQDTPPQAPTVLPAFQQWTDAPGQASYRFLPGSRIVVDPAAAEDLTDTAHLFAADLYALTGTHVAVTTGTYQPARTRRGDIHLRLASPEGLDNQEGYELQVADALLISAPTSTGVFYGTRSVLQLLRQGVTIAKGTARDWPAYTERSFMVDTARQFYSVGWLRDRIRLLSYYKYNVLHLHLSDDQAFRLESDRHPEIVSQAHYTKAQIRDLVAYAAARHITVIPEIDMPGHMTQILDSHPDLRLVGADGTVKPGALDLSKDGAYSLARDLIEEYLPLFPGPYWHLGADEWLPESQIANFPDLRDYARQKYGPDARARDAFYGFINWANDLVKQHGRTLRIWNDQLVAGYLVPVDQDVTIDYWYGSDFLDINGVLERGHEVVNSNWHELYYIIGVSRPDSAAIYENFQPHVFPVDPQGSIDIDPDSPQLRGTQLTLWGEPGVEEPEHSVAGHLRAPMAALAQVSWGSPKPVSSFVSFVPIIKQVGLPPDYEGVDEPWDVPPTPTSTLPAVAGHPLENILDDDPATYFASERPLRRDNQVTLDLNGVKQIGGVTLSMGSPDQPAAYPRQASLEISTDGSSWQQVADLTGQADVEAVLPVGTSAGFVRLRATGAQPGTSLVIREFGVTPTVSSAGHIRSSLPTYQTYTIDRATDGDLSTYFWGSKGARVGDYLLLDLGAVRDLASVHLQMSEPGVRPDDYLHQGVLEVSGDGMTWERLGEFADQPEIRVTTTTSARYVRYRVTANQGDWAIIREFGATTTD